MSQITNRERHLKRISVRRNRRNDAVVPLCRGLLALTRTILTSPRETLPRLRWLDAPIDALMPPGEFLMKGGFWQRGGSWVIVQWLFLFATLAAAPLWPGHWHGLWSSIAAGVLTAIGAAFGISGMFFLHGSPSRSLAPLSIVKSSRK